MENTSRQKLIRMDEYDAHDKVSNISTYKLLTLAYKYAEHKTKVGSPQPDKPFTRIVIMNIHFPHTLDASNSNSLWAQYDIIDVQYFQGL